MKLITIQILMIMIMWLATYILSFKKKMSLKTMSPFECGYNSMFSKLPLSIQFTLLLFVFLLFDIELSILILSNWKMWKINKTWILTMTMFLVLMMISIIYEMSKKSMKWN